MRLQSNNSRINARATAAAMNSRASESIWDSHNDCRTDISIRQRIMSGAHHLYPPLSSQSKEDQDGHNGFQTAQMHMQIEPTSTQWNCQGVAHEESAASLVGEVNVNAGP
jgi:hypothetical protein